LSGGIEEEYEKCSKVGVLSRFKWSAYPVQAINVTNWARCCHLW
jgi:hypothetical protein